MRTVPCNDCKCTGQTAIPSDVYDSGFLPCGRCHGVGRLRADRRSWSECTVCNGIGRSYQHSVGYTCGNGHTWLPPYRHK